jgi:hypothetical protein
MATRLAHEFPATGQRLSAMPGRTLCAIEQSNSLRITGRSLASRLTAKSRLHKENQFNRKVTLNAELRELKAEIARLSE